MAIEGLERGQVLTSSLADEVGVMVEALERVGLVSDNNREGVTASVTSDVEALAGSDVVGENYPHVPEGLVTLEEVVQALDTGEFAADRTYSNTYVYRPLWVPGADRGGFKAEEFGGFTQDGSDADVPAHVRRAVHSTHSPVDPLLHFLNKPFDGKYAEEGEQTQLDAIAEAVKDYDGAHEDFSMGALNAKAVAMIALMRRIAGGEMPIEEGWMYDATMPRNTVGGVSVVGDVNSNQGQFRLDGDDGLAVPEDGVGLSVGPKELKAQTS